MQFLSKLENNNYLFSTDNSFVTYFTTTVHVAVVVIVVEDLQLAEGRRVPVEKY